MNIRIEEPLPNDSIEAGAVLHVRRRLRSAALTGGIEVRTCALATLFGLPESEKERFRSVAETARPISNAAALVANDKGVAFLGHDRVHVEQCRQWLLHEKENQPAYKDMVAFDLGTLLTLSRAAELARAGDLTGRPPVAIVIRGETGTGKELLAQAIHRISGRKGDLRPIHIAGMTSDFINDELFGHVKGAFTGAATERKGRLEESDEGSILLDEVGDLPPDAQVRLLRFLQDGVFSRLGSNAEQRVNVRVIAATWHDLAEDLKKGAFRKDLYHRICVGEVLLPPLRDRRADFHRLVEGVLSRTGTSRTFTRSAIDALSTFTWPGNLRELEGVLRMAASCTSGASIRLEDLPPQLQRHYLARPLDDRAPGMLCDDAEGLGVTSEMIALRIQAVQNSILSETPLPKLPDQVEGFFRAMDSLPDPTGTHAAILQDLKKNVEAEQKGLREQQIGQRLMTIANVPQLPEDIRATLVEVATGFSNIGTQGVEAARTANSTIKLNSSPWVRLCVEVAAHPLFANDEADRAKVVPVLGFLVKLINSIAPDFVEEVRRLAHKDGLKALFERGKEIIAKTNASDKPEFSQLPGVKVPEGHAKSWTRKQWTTLVEKCASRRRLEIVTKLDGKTIKRHLEKLRITPPWSKKSQRAVSR